MAHVQCKGYDRNDRKLEEKLVENLGIVGKIILMFILNIKVDVNWIRLVHNTAGCCEDGNEPSGFIKCRNFLTNGGTISPRRTLARCICDSPMA